MTIHRRRSCASLLPLLLAALVVGGTGCGGGGRVAMKDAAAASAPRATAEAIGADVAPAAEAAPAGAPAPAPASTPAASAPQTKPTTTAASTAKPDARTAKSVSPVRAPVVIYEGDLRMLADEAVIPKTIDRIIDVAESLGGHIAGRKDASVTVKVPSASFREALTQIDALGVAVVGRSVKADDVSEEFHDLEVRLANLKSTRARLSEFLGKAANIPDMLTVERELERVALEIDRIEGRLEFLRTRAAMSVIAVSLTAKPKEVAIVAPPPPPPAAPPPLRAPELPVAWVSRLGVDPLLSLQK